MYCLGYNAGVTLACVPPCVVSPCSQPAQRSEGTRRRLWGCADAFDAGPISDSLIPYSLRHRFDLGMLQLCSDFVTAVDPQADWPDAHDTIL